MELIYDNQTILDETEKDNNKFKYNNIESLHLAIKNGSIDSVKTIIANLSLDEESKRSFIMCPDKEKGKNAIHIAAQFGNLEIAKELLQYIKPEDLYAIDKGDDTAFHIAALYNAEILNELYSKNPEFSNFVDETGNTLRSVNNDLGLFVNLVQMGLVGANLFLNKPTLNAVSSLASFSSNTNKINRFNELSKEQGEGIFNIIRNKDLYDKVKLCLEDKEKYSLPKSWIDFVGESSEEQIDKLCKLSIDLYKKNEAVDKTKSVDIPTTMAWYTFHKSRIINETNNQNWRSNKTIEQVQAVADLFEIMFKDKHISENYSIYNFIEDAFKAMLRDGKPKIISEEEKNKIVKAVTIILDTWKVPEVVLQALYAQFPDLEELIKSQKDKNYEIQAGVNTEKVIRFRWSLNFLIKNNDISQVNHSIFCPKPNNENELSAYFNGNIWKYKLSYDWEENQGIKVIGNGTHVSPQDANDSLVSISTALAWYIYTESVVYNGDINKGKGDLHSDVLSKQIKQIATIFERVLNEDKKVIKEEDGGGAVKSTVPSLRDLSFASVAQNDIKLEKGRLPDELIEEYNESVDIIRNSWKAPEVLIAELEQVFPELKGKGQVGSRLLDTRLEEIKKRNEPTL